MKKTFYIFSRFALTKKTLKKELHNRGYRAIDTDALENITDSNKNTLIIDIDDNHEILQHLARRHFRFTTLLFLSSQKIEDFPYPYIKKESKFLLSESTLMQLLQTEPLKYIAHPQPAISSPIVTKSHAIPKHPPKSYRLVLIGVSTGGPKLIEKIVRSLPATYPYPICIVQHMPENFTSIFAQRLNTLTPLEVKEAKENEVIEPGKIIIAKGGKHLTFRKRGDKIVSKLTKNINNRFFVPSVDEMFLSAAKELDPKEILAILLTGIGDDGADGMVKLKNGGAYTIAESEKSATVYGMPKEAYLRGGTCEVLDFEDILTFLLRIGENNGI